MIKFGEHQLCPKCDGSGYIAREVLPKVDASELWG